MASIARHSGHLKRPTTSILSTTRPHRSNYSSDPSRDRQSGRTAKAIPQPRLDYRGISENIVYKSNNAINRKAPLPADTIRSVARTYVEYKRISTVLNEKRNARSIVGERVRRSASEKDEQKKAAALEDASRLKEEMTKLEAAFAETEENLLTLAISIPNDTHPASPLGPESAAVTLSTHGPEVISANPERDHVMISKKLGLLDLESGASVTGHSWYYLLNEAALLEIALTNYALSVAIKHGFTPVTTPDAVRLDIANRCGFQPRDSEVTQMYHLASSSPELVLSATSEIPLAGMFANKIFPWASLPLKVVGIGHAFRAEAGARGADTRGLYRVHQFTKVELFTVTTEDSSEAMMEDMAEIQRQILVGLGFPFRVLDMPSEELGASAYRKYDMEAWMPGRGKWGEVSSLSNCTDYQSRRLHIQYRPQHPKTSGVLSFAHTLNGTAAAIPRLIVALLENGAVFNEEGDVVGIHLPEVLKPFWVGQGSGRDLIQWV